MKKIKIEDYFKQKKSPRFPGDLCLLIYISFNYQKDKEIFLEKTV